VAYTSLAHALSHAVEFTYPALLLTIERDFGISHLAAGAIAQAFAVTFGVSALPSGFLVDRLGSRRVLVLTFGAGAAGCLLVAASPGPYALAAFLALTGLCIGLYHPAGLALIAEGAEQRALAAGYHGVAGNVGVAIAPVTAVGVAALLDWRAAFVFVALLCLVVAGLVAFVQLSGSLGRARQATVEAAERAPPGDRRAFAVLFLVYGIFLANGFVYRGSLTFLPTHIEESVHVSVLGLDEKWIAGSLTTLALMAGAGGQLLGGALSLRFPLERLAPLVTLFLAPLLVVMGFASGGLLVLAAALFVFLNFSGQPITTALIADYSPEGAVGRSYGIGFFLSFGLGSFAATAAGGIADAWDVAAIYRALSAMALLSFIFGLSIMVVWSRQRGRRRSPVAGGR
jgi:MFS family permease